MYLICGATGQIGGAVACSLLNKGERVRVFVRDESKARHLSERGSEVFAGTFEDENALVAALESVAGVFLLQPNDYGSTDFVGDGAKRSALFRRALQRAGNPRVAVLSSVGAQHAAGNGPVRREHHFENEFADYETVRVVRASYFMENWANVLEAVRGPGILPTFLNPEKAIPMVAVKDIGHQLAIALTSDDAPRLTELAGPQDYTPEDVCEAFSDVCKRDISLVPESIDGVVPLFTKLGFSEHIAQLVREMYEGYANGVMAFAGTPTRGTTPLIESVRETLKR